MKNCPYCTASGNFYEYLTRVPRPVDGDEWFKLDTNYEIAVAIAMNSTIPAYKVGIVEFKRFLYVEAHNNSRVKRGAL